jgi:cytochrome c biogenesis protein
MERPKQTGRTSGGWIEFLDRTWDFFASTKVAAVLIVLLALASMSGSLIEQDHLYQDWRPPALYYPERYGPFWGNLYMKLGLTHAYSSLWFATIVLLVVISLIICSLHRLIPLHKMLTHPQVWKLPHFITRQDVTAEMAEPLETVEAKLKRRGFKVIRDRECLYGDRGRLSRYGPYIIHIGLLIVAFAAISKAVPGWNETRDVWIPDGSTVKVPDTNFAITNYKFTMEFYPNGAPARYATDAGLVVDGKETRRQTIEVNHPLSYQGWDMYQTSFRQEPGIAHMTVATEGGQAVKQIDFDLRDPQTEYPVTDSIKLVVRSYFHDFMIDKATQQPANASFEVKNPVMMGDFVDEKGNTVGRIALAILDQGKSAYQGPFIIKVGDVDTRWYTALKLHKDKTVPFMFGGLGVIMLGMYITFFMFHWQVWVREEDGKLLIGARAYKNKFGLKQEIRRLVGTPQGEGTV